MTRDEIIKGFKELGINLEWKMFGTDGGYHDLDQDNRYLGNDDKEMEEWLLKERLRPDKNKNIKYTVQEDRHLKESSSMSRRGLDKSNSTEVNDIFKIMAENNKDNKLILELNEPLKTGIRDGFKEMIEENYKNGVEKLNETKYNHRLKLLNGKKETMQNIIFYALDNTNGVLRDYDSNYILRVVKTISDNESNLIMSKVKGKLTKETIINNMKEVLKALYSGEVKLNRNPTLSKMNFVNLEYSSYMSILAAGFKTPEFYERDSRHNMSNADDTINTTTDKEYTPEELIGEIKNYTTHCSSLGLTCNESVEAAIRIKQRRAEDTEYDPNRSMMHMLTLGKLESKGKSVKYDLYKLMICEMKRILPDSLFENTDKTDEEVIYNYLYEKYGYTIKE